MTKELPREEPGPRCFWLPEDADGKKHRDDVRRPRIWDLHAGYFYDGVVPHARVSSLRPLQPHLFHLFFYCLHVLGLFPPHWWMVAAERRFVAGHCTFDASSSPV